jgi:RimJ/RimL family protein N-acetyltransferase
MPSFPSLATPPSDGVVALRLSEERDIPEILISYQDDRRLSGALGEERPPSGAALGSRAERAAEDRRAGRALTLTVLRGDSDVCVGEVRVGDVDWESGRASMQVWLAPALRGQGLARRAHALALDWLERECGLEGVCRKAS